MFKWLFNNGQTKEERFSELMKHAISELEHSQNIHKSNEVRKHYISNAKQLIKEAEELLK